MKENKRRGLCWLSGILVVAMVLSIVQIPVQTAAKAKKKISVANVDSSVLVLRPKKGFNVKVHINNKKAGKMKLKYKVKNKKIASVSKKGRVILRKKGKTKLIISGKNAKKATLTLIGGTPIKKVNLKNKNIVIQKNTTTKISASVQPAKASYKKLKWSSDNESIVKVSQNGAIEALNTGTATVLVRAMDGSKKGGKCIVQVVETAVPSGQQPTEPSTAPSGEQNANPTITPLEAPKGKISIDTHFWESLLETISFGLYKAPDKSVTIIAENKSNRIEYYVDNTESNQARTAKELDSILFTEYTAPFSLSEGKHVVYAKIIDHTNANNYAYICSDGIVSTITPPAPTEAAPTAAVPTAAVPTAAAPTAAAPTEAAPTAAAPTAAGPTAAAPTAVAPTAAAPTVVPTVKPSAAPTVKPEIIRQEELETMTKGGSYAGNIDTPFNGVALYANGDFVSGTVGLVKNKKYEVVVTGASNNSSQARVSVYVGGEKRGVLYFDGTTKADSSVKFSYKGETQDAEIKFIVEDDNGAFDVYLDKYKISCIGDIPAAPTIPPVGAVASGNYRNLFVESGKTQEEVQEKVNAAWQQLFYGDEETERIYYPVGGDMAYILDTGNDDVRSEGMSYGMMICVQMDKKEEFDRLWKWARTYMYHESGERKGWFAWQCGTDGSVKDHNSATDGEEYFATALLFAAKRWGNGSGIFDYDAEAQALLNEMLHHDEMAEYYGLCNMFDSTHNLPVFVPYGSAASFSDPSYVLPAFYEIWALDATKDNERWRTITTTGREYFKKSVNETTGLAPDYANFDGTPNAQGNHGDFRFDAWRVICNIAVDYAWWGKDDWAVTQANRQLNFFYSQGVSTYGNQWSLTGTSLSEDHSPGLTAMNAVGCLASTSDVVWDFVEDFWNAGVPSGTYRYYDGCLYMMGLLHCSGNFKAYIKNASVDSGETPTPKPTTSPATTPTPSPSLEPDETPNPATATDYTLDYVNTHGSYSSSEEGEIDFVEKADKTLLIKKNSSYSNPNIFVKISLPEGRKLKEYKEIDFEFSTTNAYQKIGIAINNSASTSGAYEVVPPANSNIDGSKKITVNHTFAGMNESIGNSNEFYLIVSYHNWAAVESILSKIHLAYNN